MKDYYVTLQKYKGNRRVLHYIAESFAHAEEQANQDIEPDEEIITIESDY